jgi:hypothetical protein
MGNASRWFLTLLALCGCDDGSGGVPSSQAAGTTHPAEVIASPTATSVAEQVRAHLADFSFELCYAVDGKQPPVRVVLSVPERPRLGAGIGVKVVRIDAMQAGRLVDWLDADGFLVRGDANRRKTVLRPPPPYFLMTVSVGEDDYFAYGKTTDENVRRLEELAAVLDGNARDNILRVVRLPEKTSGQIKADNQ